MTPELGELWVGPPTVSNAHGIVTDDRWTRCESCGARVGLFHGPRGKRAWLDGDPGVFYAVDNPGQDADEVDWPEHTPERCRETRAVVA